MAEEIVHRKTTTVVGLEEGHKSQYRRGTDPEVAPVVLCARSLVE